MAIGAPPVRVLVSAATTLLFKGIAMHAELVDAGAPTDVSDIAHLRFPTLTPGIVLSDNSMSSMSERLNMPL